MEKWYMCDGCQQVGHGVEHGSDCPKAGCPGKFYHRVMTQQEVENWIMLKGQSQERWFDIRARDPEIDSDPTMRALLESLSEMINNGIHNMPFLEAAKVEKPDLAVVKPSGRSAKGD